MKTGITRVAAAAAATAALWLGGTTAIGAVEGEEVGVVPENQDEVCLGEDCVIVLGDTSSNTTRLTPADACPEAAKFYLDQGLKVDAFLGDCPQLEMLERTVAVAVPIDEE